MSIEVTIQLDGKDVRAGSLWCYARRGVESASFAYDPAYLARPRPLALSPELPPQPGTFHSQGCMFHSFSDCMPDRWGRMLLVRAEGQRARQEHNAARSLLEVDFLLGVSDVSRQGALRFWRDSQALAPSRSGVPREVRIPALLRESQTLEGDTATDIRDLFEAGSSLGGARPKASVRDARGTLAIAKFPKANESLLDDVCAWEKTALDLAAQVGIRVPVSRLMRVNGKAVLLLTRFDRDGSRRIPYLSGLTAIQGNDDGFYSYLELVEFLEEQGSCPQQDIRELWSRIAFSCLIGNTDDHMRNHGFLWDGRGWRLSPAFDINPTEGAGEKHLRCMIDLDNNTADIRVAVDSCEYFRLTRSEAIITIARMRQTLSHWRKVASANGISKASMDRMASCFDGAAGTLA